MLSWQQAQLLSYSHVRSLEENPEPPKMKSSPSGRKGRRRR